MVKDYYKILDIKKGSTHCEIKKAYRKLAMKFHPDRNRSPGAEDRFKEVGEAYAVLSDTKKRTAYHKSLDDERPKKSRNFRRSCPYSFTYHGDTRSTYTQFFGTSSPYGPEGNEMLRPPNEYDLYVSLEDINRGCSRNIKITRRVLQPDGSTRMEEKVVTIIVKPGWKTGTRVTFPRQGDQARRRIPADLVFTVKEFPHPSFKRVGSDIRYVAKIPLSAALCGTTVKVPTLEGVMKAIDLTHEIVKPTTLKRLQGYGLPFPDETGRRGDLLVSFDVEFPDHLSLNTKATIFEALFNK